MRRQALLARSTQIRRRLDTQSVIRSSWFISGGSEVVLTFMPWEVAKEFANTAPEGFYGSFGSLSQERL